MGSNYDPFFFFLIVEVAYFEEKSLNLNSHRTIYYSISLSKFFSLHFQQIQTDNLKFFEVFLF